MFRSERMNVKVDSDLLRKAKVVAATKQVTLSNYVSALLRPLIEKDLSEIASVLAGVAVPGVGRPAESSPSP
jgi:hypothetical protein